MTGFIRASGKMTTPMWPSIGWLVLAGWPAWPGRFLTGARKAAPNIRIDTHHDNRVMQHLLTKHGFTYCGLIYLKSGAERLAYQRVVKAADHVIVLDEQ